MTEISPQLKKSIIKTKLFNFLNETPSQKNIKFSEKKYYVKFFDPLNKTNNFFRVIPSQKFNKIFLNNNGKIIYINKNASPTEAETTNAQGKNQFHIYSFHLI